MIKGSIRARLLAASRRSQSSRRPVHRRAHRCTERGGRRGSRRHRCRALQPSAARRARRTRAVQDRLLERGGVGNGFREEQVCTAKAEAKASGQVSELVVKHRNTDAAGQASDIRDLIAAGVKAIVFNPNDTAALNPALQEAKAAGIKTVSVDAYVTDPDTYNLYNNQVKYAELGAKWLFDQLGGKGTVWYTRGLAGHPADSDRDIGFKNVLKDYPNIKVVPGRRRRHRLGSGQGDAAGQRLHLQRPVRQDPGDLGIRHGQADRRRDQARPRSRSCRSPTPTSVASSPSSSTPSSSRGSKGAAVTNTAAVGGAGITLALSSSTARRSRPTGASQPNTVLLDRSSSTTRPTRARPSSRHGSPSPAWIRCGRSACRSRTGRRTTRTRFPRLQGRASSTTARHPGGAGSAGVPRIISDRDR